MTDRAGRASTTTPRKAGAARTVSSVDDPRAVRVAIIAEVRLYREGLASNLASRRNLVIVGTAGNAAGALALVASTQPDVVVLDMATPESLHIVDVIGRDAPNVKIIAFAVEESAPEILACAEAGVAGYVPSDGSTDELVAMIENVAGGEIRCSPRMAAMLFGRLASLAKGGVEQLGTATLTSRERQIVALIDDGLSNKEIAVRLSIEVATVKNHVHNILEKLHVKTRAEAAARLRGGAQPRRQRSTKA